MAGTARKVTVNGVGLHVEDTGGSGPPVVFSHGLLFSTRLFDAQVEALRDRYRCISFDHRGQGQSDDVRGRSSTIETCYQDAVALIEALSLAPCHFVGLSMGGFVGMRIGGRWPKLLRSLALLDTSADPEPEQNIGSYRMLNLIARNIGLWPVAGKVMPIMFGRTFLSDPARAQQRAEWEARLRGNRRSIWRAVNGVLEREAFTELANVRAPTLVMVGEEDVATVPAKSEKLAAAIPGARLVRIPRAGHSSSVEEPAFVTARLREHLDAAEAGRAHGGAAHP